MASYGNNKGKKYRKLTGAEVATKESLRAARAFMGWYGLSVKVLARKIAGNYDDQVATDTAIKIYDDIAIKGTVISGKYRSYYLRAYANNYAAYMKKAGEVTARFDSLDIELDEAQSYHETIAAPEFDAQAYEEATDLLRAEIIEFVRANYPEESVSIFEIYMELLPEISYKKLATLFGMPHQKIWQAIGEIKRDVAIRFEARRDFLLSII